PSGWIRDTAQQQLLVRRGHQDDVDVRPQLLALAKDAAQPVVGRIHAMWTLAGLTDQALSEEIVRLAQDPDPRVQVQALRIGDELALWSKVPVPGSEVVGRSRALAPPVRLQLAYSLGARPDGGRMLAELLAHNRDDRFITAAVLSSVNKATWPGFFNEIVQQTGFSEGLVAALTRLATVYGAPLDTARWLARQIETDAGTGRFEQMARLAAVLDVLEQKQTSLRALTGAADTAMSAQIEKVFAAARAVAADPKTAPGEAILAIALLGRGFDRVDDDLRLLARFLTPVQPEDVQIAAIRRLGSMANPHVAKVLLAPWKNLTPTVRAAVLDALFSHVESTRAIIEALDQGRLLPHEIDTVRRHRLLDHRDDAIRAAAERLLAASASADRHALVDRYLKAMPERGDAAAGGKLFAKLCAACHQLGGVGQQVGPDLASIGDKSTQGLATAILDPNRAVEARYVNYLVTTKAGRSYNGLLLAETSTTISLVAADGTKHDLLRRDIDELVSTGRSAMPEGFEKELSPAALADLIAYLRGQIAQPKRFDGNHPRVVQADGDGSIRLTAATAAIYGKTLVFEEKYQNLGYWSSTDDQAVWTLETAKAARYEVWIDYACETPGNQFALQIGSARLTHKVAGTASWDLYRQTKIGVVRLAAGRHDAILRPEGVIHGALLDLKEIRLVPTQEP
ncbi:MAG: c-type cytochrome, partial [Gemmataceae bacterium]|nr:c-type cytochrome [Gemmataceae bacterium]